MSIYYPKSVDFIKNRAKLLRKHFPELSVSAAQNSTSLALGFKDWFDATKRIGSPGIVSGIPDEQVSCESRLQRRYQQSRALIDYTDLPPNDIDEFVRHWNLTSSHQHTLNEFVNTYNGVLHDLVTDKGFDEENSRIDISEWEKPRMLVDGIIRAYGGGKHFYFYVSPYRFVSMPPFLRGNFAGFLENEDGHFVKLAFASEFPEHEVMESLYYASTQEPLIYEWLTGKMLPRQSSGFDDEMTFKQMADEAKQYPNEWFALSYRSDFTDVNNPVAYYPAITGSDFIKFIESKGLLDGLNLKWYKVKPDVLPPIRCSQLRIDLSTVDESPAIYSSPFKMRPMSSIEFSFSVESGSLMLDEELEGSWWDEYTKGLTVIESENGSVIQKTHIPDSDL